MPLLENIESPRDLRALDRDRLDAVATEVRERMIDVVSRVGGHFAPGLGVVELTVALHYVFDTPRDRLVWDVGHQAYPHKLLTGRGKSFERIRMKGGASGFLKREESEYDAFGAGHAATSISAALGMATQRDLAGDDYKVVAIIGDGAMTSGMAYEGMNNAGHTERDIIVVLNDNEMSISPNVGAMHKYLNKVVTNPLYNRVREEIKRIVRRSPEAFEEIVLKVEESVKGMLTPGALFEELGFRYFGPVPGHDLDALVDTFEQVRRMTGPRLVHVVTKKGKGFPLAEQNPVVWHGATPFDKISGKMEKKAGLPAYTSVFGRGLIELGAEYADLAVITAAMPGGTGTGVFGDAYPERYFDVGIAEGHAVTFAAGMAADGGRPLAAIYSTFLQRAYDSIIHDVAIQKLPVIFCMDRAGLVGNDGPTHMGLYDIAYLLAVPNAVVTAPKDGAEMLALTRLGVSMRHPGPFTVRYPRDSVPFAVPPLAEIAPLEFATWETLRSGSGVALLATGTMVLPALEAARLLAAEGIDATVVNCRFLKPMDLDTLADVVAGHEAIVTIEEGTEVNGFGSAVGSWLAQHATERAHRFAVMGVPDRLIDHANRGEQLAEVGLTPDGIAARARALLESATLIEVRQPA